MLPVLHCRVQILCMTHGNANPFDTVPPQMVIPRLTENYGASRDPPEKQAPMCTVHSFPHNIDHCLTWARSEFEGLLEKSPSEANVFLADADKYIAEVRGNPDAAAREQLAKVRTAPRRAAAQPTFRGGAGWACCTACCTSFGDWPASNP